jgi:hypothetical protein
MFPNFPIGNLHPDKDWALALARGAVIRPLDRLPDRSEVIESLVVTASDELKISRSLIYRLVAKLRTAAAGFANGRGVMILALCTDNHPCALAKSQENRGLSTI